MHALHQLVVHGIMGDAVKEDEWEVGGMEVMFGMSVLHDDSLAICKRRRRKRRMAGAIENGLNVKYGALLNMRMRRT